MTTNSKLSEGKGICTYCQYWDISCGETCPKCGRICDGSQIDTSLLDKKKTKELDWHIKWDYLLNKKKWKNPDEVNKVLTKFVEDLFTQQRTELLEEIKTRIDTFGGFEDDGGNLCHYDSEILEWVNDLLNKKDE